MKWVTRKRVHVNRRPITCLPQESGDTTDNRFPVAVRKDGTYKDVTLSVRARPLSGHVDQGFGLVWRYKDARNYYVTRCNALEDNCRVYHVVNGAGGRSGPRTSRSRPTRGTPWRSRPPATTSWSSSTAIACLDANG